MNVSAEIINARVAIRRWVPAVLSSVVKQMSSSHMLFQYHADSFVLLERCVAIGAIRVARPNRFNILGRRQKKKLRDPLVYSIKCILTRDRSTGALHKIATTAYTLQTRGAGLSSQVQGHSSSQTTHGFGRGQVSQLRGSKGPGSVKHVAENPFLLSKLHDIANTYKTPCLRQCFCYLCKLVRVSTSCLSRKVSLYPKHFRALANQCTRHRTKVQFCIKISLSTNTCLHI